MSVVTSEVLEADMRVEAMRTEKKFESAGTEQNFEAVSTQTVGTEMNSEDMGWETNVTPVPDANVVWSKSMEFALVTTNNTVPKVIDAKTGRTSRIRAIKDGDTMTCATFSRFNNIIAVCTNAGHTIVYEAASKKIRKIYEAQNPISAIDFNSDDSMIGIACSHGIVLIMTETDDSKICYHPAGSTVTVLRFHPCCKTIFAVGTSQGDVFVYDLTTKKRPIHEYQVKSGRSVKMIEFAPGTDQNLMIVVYSNEEQYSLFNWRDAVLCGKGFMPEGIIDISFATSGIYFAIGLRDYTIYYYNIKKPLIPILRTTTRQTVVNGLHCKLLPSSFNHINRGLIKNQEHSEHCPLWIKQVYRDVMQTFLDEYVKTICNVTREYVKYIEFELMKLDETLDSQYDIGELSRKVQQEHQIKINEICTKFIEIMQAEENKYGISFLPYSNQVDSTNLNQPVQPVQPVAQVHKESESSKLYKERHVEVSYHSMGRLGIVRSTAPGSASNMLPSEWIHLTEFPPELRIALKTIEQLDDKEFHRFKFTPMQHTRKTVKKNEKSTCIEEELQILPHKLSTSGTQSRVLGNAPPERIQKLRNNINRLRAKILAPINEETLPEMPANPTVIRKKPKIMQKPIGTSCKEKSEKLTGNQPTGEFLNFKNYLSETMSPNFKETFIRLTPMPRNIEEDALEEFSWSSSAPRSLRDDYLETTRAERYQMAMEKVRDWIRNNKLDCASSKSLNENEQNCNGVKLPLEDLEDSGFANCEFDEGKSSHRHNMCNNTEEKCETPVVEVTIAPRRRVQIVYDLDEDDVTEVPSQN